jgi:hypothetical protein
MTLGIGANTIFGHGEESAFGTPVTCDRFHEFLSETLDRNQKIVQSQAIRGGLRQSPLGARRANTNHDASGDVKFEIGTNSYGRLLKHLLGAVSTTPLGGSPAAYQHTITPGNLQGLSLTLQKQIRDAAGAAVSTLTYPGSKITAMEFTAKVGELLHATANFDCRDEVSNISPAAASYIAQTLFHFGQCTLKLNGTPASNATEAGIKIENALKKDRWFLGQGGLKAEQLPNNFLKVTGKLSAEFANQADYYDRFVGDTSVLLVLEFVGPTISGSNAATLRFTCQDVRFTGETPQVKGVDVVMTDVPFEAAWDGTNPTVKIDLITSDATP